MVNFTGNERGRILAPQNFLSTMEVGQASEVRIPLSRQMLPEEKMKAARVSDVTAGLRCGKAEDESGYPGLRGIGARNKLRSNRLLSAFFAFFARPLRI